MEGEKKQGKVIGLDVHPSCFSAAAFDGSNTKVHTSAHIWLHNKVPMERFEKWLLKHTNENDTLVMESLQISFRLVKLIQSHRRHGIVLESCHVGQLGKSYLKNDKVDAIKIAKVFLAGFNEQVWVPDERTLERREIFFAYQKAVRDCTRISNRTWAFLTGNGLVLKGHMKTHLKKGLEHLLGLKDWSHKQRIILEMHYDDYQNACKKRQRYEAIMAEEVTSDREMLLLQQFYGIRLVSAYGLMAIIGDIKRFKTPKKLVAYIGLQPKIVDSGVRSITGGVGKKGRKDLKAILSECAKAIIQYAPADHPIAKWARKLKYRKNSNVVTMAVARKLVVAIWYVLNGYSSPMTEISKMIEVKLIKLAGKIGKVRRKELGFKDISHFIEIKGNEFVGFT